MALGITRFSRFGANLGRLHLLSARLMEALDGTDELTITCEEDLAKGDYLVWRDSDGTWREHIVDRPSRTHDETGAPLTIAVCIGSISETWDDWVDDVRPRGTVTEGLSAILANTRWSVGSCTQTGTASHTFYHESVRECLQELVAAWGGEMVVTIACDGSHVTGRSVAVVSARGDQDSPKRFTWTKDLVGISRDVGSDNPKSRIYAYGKGEKTEAGGYGRRIGIADVNDGIPYVEDADATQLWGRPDGSGGILPAVGRYVNDQCEDPSQLKAEALDYLEKAKQPKVTYTASVIDLASFGRDWEGVGLGDCVTIVDREFSPDGLRLKGRVSKVERDLLSHDATITFGTLVDALAGPWADLQTRLASLSRRSSNWDLAGTAEAAWLDTLMAGLNAAYDSAGTYHYSSFEKGEIWSNVPLDEDGNATQGGGWAMNINGLGFRLASSLNADGSWNWRTFGTGNGFVANEVVAGIVRDAIGASYWDLDTGTLHLGAATQIGETTLDDAVATVQEGLTATAYSLTLAIEDAKRFATDYLTYANGELTLGATDSAIRNVLTNSRMSYRTDAGDIAWFGLSGDIWEMFIANASITDMLRFGNFAWIARQNGNMTIKWVG